MENSGSFFDMLQKKSQFQVIFIFYDSGLALHSWAFGHIYIMLDLFCKYAVSRY